MTHFGGIKQYIYSIYIYTLILMDFPYNSLFGVVIHHDPCIKRISTGKMLDQLESC